MLSLAIGSSAAACATLAYGADEPKHHESRSSVLARAQLWRPTTISAMNLKEGPSGEGSFPFMATVHCDYLDKKLSGHSPKFACMIDDKDEVKVKFGGTNGEVFGEVLATRLLWALGFGADRMYPVNVICRKCPSELGGIERAGDESRFDPAVIERKMEGKEWSGSDGWGWPELAKVDPERGGAPLEQRDALKLLAVFLQHTDSKRGQQRILCLGAVKKSGPCEQPFLMISDLGLTFGHATRSNGNDPASVNLDEWRHASVWRDEKKCVGNLPRSFTGTLENPLISEGGRRFLANLLGQLSDDQIHDLFAVARVELRLRRPGHPSSGFATVDEWVDAFKDKRQEIVERRCV